MGSVVVYNIGFESRINRELSVSFPNHADALEGINSRMVDLLVPFRSRYLYHPKMMGSASIKKVLPAFETAGTDICMVVGEITRSECRR